MRKVLRIGIEKPCGENWAKFPKQRDGFVLKGHCASCNKHVIDFTTWSDERIRDYFSSKPVDVCGRLRSSQLKDYQLQKKQRKSFQYFYGLLLTALLSFTSKLTEAQVRDKPLYASDQRRGKPNQRIENQTASSAIIVSGVVVDDIDSVAVPGVNVIQKNTTNGTVTELDGSFELLIKDPGDSAILIFSFIGLKTVEKTISLRDNKDLKIVMGIESGAFLGEIIVGGVGSRRISPRRWWWKFKGLFSGYRY